MTIEAIRDTWTLNQGPLTVDPTGDWVKGGVELTGVLNTTPQLGPAMVIAVHQKHGGVMTTASVARESCYDQGPLTTPGPAILAERGRARAALRMEAMQCPLIEGNS